MSWSDKVFAAALDVPSWLVVGREMLQGRLKELREKNSRVDVARLMKDMSADKLSKLAAKLKEAANLGLPISENDLANALGDVLPKDKDGKVKHDDGVKMLEWVADLDKINFKVFSYLLFHDPFTQKIKAFFRWAEANHKDVWKVLGILTQQLELLTKRSVLQFAKIDFRNDQEMEIRFREYGDNLHRQVEEELGMNWFQLGWRMICGG